MEVLSVIGGYMGLWLGFSLVTLYDLAYDAVLCLKSKFSQQKKRQTTVKKFKKKPKARTSTRREAY